MSNNSLNDHLSHLLSQANKHLSRQLNADGVSLDQWRVMKLLSDDGGQPMGHLADALALGLPTVSKLVDRMVNEALLYRVPDPDDRRRVRIFISEKGKALLATQSELVREYETRVEGDMGSEEMRRLREMIEQLIERIK